MSTSSSWYDSTQQQEQPSISTPRCDESSLGNNHDGRASFNTARTEQKKRNNGAAATNTNMNKKLATNVGTGCPSERRTTQEVKDDASTFVPLTMEDLRNQEFTAGSLNTHVMNCDNYSPSDCPNPYAANAEHYNASLHYQQELRSIPLHTNAVNDMSNCNSLTVGKCFSVEPLSDHRDEITHGHTYMEQSNNHNNVIHPMTDKTPSLPFQYCWNEQNAVSTKRSNAQGICLNKRVGTTYQDITGTSHIVDESYHQRVKSKESMSTGELYQAEERDHRQTKSSHPTQLNQGHDGPSSSKKFKQRSSIVDTNITHTFEYGENAENYVSKSSMHSIASSTDGTGTSGKCTNEQFKISSSDWGWQTDEDLSNRRQIVLEIAKIVGNMYSGDALSHDKLNFMAKRLEECLYKSANTKDEYMDLSTLSKRLKAIAMFASTPHDSCFPSEARAANTELSSNNKINLQGNVMGNHDADRHAPWENNQSLKDDSSYNVRTIGGGKAAAQDQKVIRQQQRRLILLRHASKCSKGANCRVKCCQEMVELWKHMKTCREDNCSKSHCLSSRCVLNHYLSCKERNETHSCAVCAPVMTPLQGGRTSIEETVNIHKKTLCETTSLIDDIKAIESKLDEQTKILQTLKDQQNLDEWKFSAELLGDTRVFQKLHNQQAFIQKCEKCLMEDSHLLKELLKLQS